METKIDPHLFGVSSFLQRFKSNKVVFKLRSDHLNTFAFVPPIYFKCYLNELGLDAQIAFREHIPFKIGPRHEPESKCGSIWDETSVLFNTQRIPPQLLFLESVSC